MLRRVLLALVLAAGGCSSSTHGVRAPKAVVENDAARPMSRRLPPLRQPSLDVMTAAAALPESSSDVAADAAVFESEPVPAQHDVSGALRLSAPHNVAEEETTSPEPLPLPAPTGPLSLEEVVTAVYASYPSLDAASRERQIAAGKQLAAMGEFDVNLVGEALTEPMGYYKNYRYALGFKQYNWGGSETFSGYRLGRGFFEPWYKERLTNEGGEFKTGVAVPLLKNRDIDKRRAAVFQARIDQAAAEPILQLEVIDAVRSATLTYWDWVAAGQRVKIAERVLRLATERQTGLERRAARGEIAGIELVDNRRLVVSRQAKQIEAGLKLQQAAIKLSLFLRDPAGIPLLASPDQLPAGFPTAELLLPEAEPEMVASALRQRPELRLLELEQEQQRIAVREANNLSLPALDGVVAASQDVGAPSSKNRDKSPFELEAGILLEVPLERRAARGKLLEARGKLAQIAAKRELAEQTIAAEVQSARAALAANHAALVQARRNVELAQEIAEAERKKLEQGDSNILTVNLREIATVDAELLVLEAESDYFMAEAQLRAAMAAELSGDGAENVEDLP